MTTYVTFHFYVIFEVKSDENRTVRIFSNLQYTRKLSTLGHQYFEELPFIDVMKSIT